MPSDSGSRRAASGGALERRNTATASRSRTAPTIQSVPLARRFMRGRQEYPNAPGEILDFEYAEVKMPPSILSEEREERLVT